MFVILKFIILVINISILDLNIPILLIIKIFWILSLLLLIIYFILIFVIFNKKNTIINGVDLLQLKKEINLKKNIEYFEEEIFLAKKFNE